MARFSMAVIGSAEVQKAFAVLPGKIRGKILRPALRAGAKVIADATKHEAQSTFSKTGDPAPHISDTLHVRAMKRPKRGQIGIVVITGSKSELGIPETTKTGQRRGYYPMALEHGWTPGLNRQRAIREAKRRGTDRGGISALAAELGTRKIPANPFMKRAFHAAKDEARRVIEADVEARLRATTTAALMSGAGGDA